MERNYRAHGDVLANRGHGKEGAVFAGSSDDNKSGRDGANSIEKVNV